jgi:hypothetical protein
MKNGTASLWILGLLMFPGTALAGNWGEAWGTMAWGLPVSVPSVQGIGLIALALALSATTGWVLRKRRTALGLPVLLVLLAVPLVVVAGTVTVPNTFVNGTPADANLVNENFGAVETAVNDNDSRILAVETDTATALSTADTAATDAVAAQTTADTAATDAATAQSTATAAATDAASAQVTADTALVDAAAALITADTALADASAALSTADAGAYVVDGFNIQPNTGTGNEHIDSLITNSLIASPCTNSNECWIGESDKWPRAPNSIQFDLEMDATWDTYIDGTASYSLIIGADDSMVNAQLSSSISCRHCKVCAVQTSSGHLGVGPGANTTICGEMQYTYVQGINNSILGPTTASGAKVSNDFVAGGSVNMIDHRTLTVTGAASGGNVIVGGTGNLIETTDAMACQNCGIFGGKTNLIQNNNSGLSLQHVQITGGTNNVIESIAGKVSPINSQVSGSYGYAWLRNQVVIGAGPGYDTTDQIVGGLQRWTTLPRGKIQSAASTKLSFGPTGSSPVLAHDGVYQLDGHMSCHTVTDITTTDPVDFEKWTISAIMVYNTGVSSRPRFSNGSALANTIQFTRDFRFGPHSTWTAGMVNFFNGVFALEVTLGSDWVDSTDDVYCQGELFVVQSRSETP